MKSKIILVILAVILFVSCSEKYETDPIKVLVDANESMRKVNSATFDLRYNYITPQENYKVNVKVYIKKTNNQPYPYILRFEYDDGTISIYDGKEFRWLDTKTKQITRVTEENDPIGFITGNWIGESIDMVVTTQDMTKSLKESKDTIKIHEPAKVGERNTNVLRKDKFFSEFGVNLISFRYYDTKDKICLKDSSIQQSSDSKTLIVHEITNLKLHRDIPADLFKLEPKNDQKLVDYQPPQQLKELKAGDLAPDFKLLDGDGKEVSLSSLKGKVVVLDFWGTWCIWCIRAMPQLEELRKEFEGNKSVAMYGISCKEPEDANPAKFLKDKGVNYQTLLKGDEVAVQFGVSGFPTLFVIDKTGKIAEVKVGFSPELKKEIGDIIRKNL